MDLPVNESLTLADKIVLDNLRGVKPDAAQDDKTVLLLEELNNPTSPNFLPTVFTIFPEPPPLNRLWRAYLKWASGVVRRPTDIVFMNHVLLYLCTSLPSALYLFYNFTTFHAILHWAWTAYSCGPFTLLMHNSIHQNGVLKPAYRWLDVAFPYLLCPLMGHTWNSYYYHHTKMHHVEGNGPEDVSSTLSYQRDSVPHLLHYIGRFIFTLWFELPRYFLKKGRRTFAVKSGLTELFCYSAIAYLYFFVNRKAAIVTLLVPLIQMRIGMAVGNWGQHAFIDRDDPDSDFRSSITLIDVSSNRLCFNDGYHTSHHLHPRRHWRDHPASLIRQKDQYTKQDALIFYDIDYLAITYRLMKHDYKTLAKHFLPLGDQGKMSEKEVLKMLQDRTKVFTEDEIRKHWPSKKPQ